MKKRYTDAMAETLSSIMEPGTADAQRIHSTAVKFVAEFQTAGWVVSQNYNTGMAPSSVSMASASVALLEDIAPVGVHSLKLLPMVKYWAVRFRNAASQIWQAWDTNSYAKDCSSGIGSCLKQKRFLLSF